MTPSEAQLMNLLRDAGKWLEYLAKHSEIKQADGEVLLVLAKIKEVVHG